MKKINTSPLSGMQELTPAMQAQFDKLKSGIAQAFWMHGFQHIETPLIERTEVLLAKAGGDTEKQIYKVIKTDETADKANQALRFDHTVPLARYTVEHMNHLAFPFKVTQIARNFRGERAQRGRFREFYQCDVDVVGRENLPVAYDAEVIATLTDAIRVLPVPEFVVRVSNRKLLGGMLEELNLEHLAEKIFSVVDHAEKVPKEKTEMSLEELGLGAENVVKITTFIEMRGERLEIIDKLRSFGFENENFQAGIAELDEVLGLVEVLSPGTKVIADMLIVRGLDYYTGTVFETVVPQYREFGSICSGGRYENLAGYYTEQSLPGVGGSIGLTRLFAVLVEAELVQASKQKPIDACVIPLSEHEIAEANRVADNLRKTGWSVDVVLGDNKLSAKLKYASRVARKAAVIGDDELKSGKYKLRDFESGVDAIQQI